jgi:hypothetical protein
MPSAEKVFMLPKSLVPPEAQRHVADEPSPEMLSF